MIGTRKEGWSSGMSNSASRTESSAVNLCSIVESKKGATARRPLSIRSPAASMAGGVHRARAPHIDAGKQEQPHHVDEMPVPGAELEAEMLRRREVPEIGAGQADD